tara:strand:- start:468 stop:1361 length:894 start_codon:yes stop_codon:yes gene_type:complete
MLKSFICTLLLCSTFSQDTFSIVAIDTVTGEIGSAGASCIQNSIIISDVHPGLGAIHTQSYWNAQNQDSASVLIESGFSAQEIIDWLRDNDSQNDPSIRQYGVVTTFPVIESAAYTGENCFDYKNHIVGSNYSIQGNILLSQAVLDTMEFAFTTTYGNFEEKLIASIMAANISGADTRCLDYDTPAISSFIRIAKPNNNLDSLYLDIDVNNAPLTVNPLDSLFKLYWTWKIEHFSIGDLNFDNTINIFDVIMLIDHLYNYSELEESSLMQADLNESGDVEITDLYLLVYHITGTLNN